MISTTCRLLLLLLAATNPASSAFAHIVLEKREAAAGTYYKAVFQVGHGCNGSATTSINVQIPDGVIAVKPMQKSGWALTTAQGAYANSHMHHGHHVSEGVRSIEWTGRLGDEFYDEFVVSMLLTDVLKPGTRLDFPVVQTCEQGTSRWVEIPKEGEPRARFPAPSLMLAPRP